MKTLLKVNLVILCLALFSAYTFAEENESKMMDQGKMKSHKMGLHHKKMSHDGMMCPMCGMMKCMSMNKSIVATKDDGVIVMVGNKLIKYDKNLEFKKEVEITIDVESMQKMMKEMMEKCPMCHPKGEMGENMESSKEEASK